MQNARLRLLFFCSLAALLASGQFLVTYFLPVGGGLDVAAYPLGRDFINIWTAAQLVAEGRTTLLFNLLDYTKAMGERWGSALPFHAWSYPPSLLPLIRPFALLEYFPALMLWTAAGMLALAAAVWSKLSTPWIALILLSPAALVNIIGGQNGFFTAALFLAGLYALPKRPLLAGICFGLLTLKPHLGILIPFVLVMHRQWRCIAMAGVVAIVLIVVSGTLYGWPLWLSFFTNTTDFQYRLISVFEGFYTLMMPGVLAGARLVDVPIGWAWAIHAPLALACGALALWIVRREGLTPRSILALTLGTLIVTPYGFNYDMMVVQAALAVYLSTSGGGVGSVHRVWPLLWMSPLLVFLLNALAIPAVAVLMVAGLILLARECRCEKPCIIARESA